MPAVKRTHPSGRYIDHYPATGTPKSRALAKLLRAHSRLPDMQTGERRWRDQGSDVWAEASWTRNKPNRQGGWVVWLYGDDHGLRSPGYAKTLRVALRGLARRLEGRAVVHAPRCRGLREMPAEAYATLVQVCGLRDLMTVDPHRIPEHRPGRPDHLRDLIAKWHRTA